MSKKFKIKNNPTFREEVNIPRVGGEPIKVGFEFKYMTRKQLAEMYDEWQGRIKDIIPTIEENEGNEEDVSLSDITDMEIKLQVGQIKDIVVGWDFEDEFNDENIEALIESSLHVAKILSDSYQEAYTKVKLGN